jgi:hypothetical protein
MEDIRNKLVSKFKPEALETIITALEQLGVESLDDIGFVTVERLEAKGILPVTAAKAMNVLTAKEDDSEEGVANQLGIDQSTLLLMLAGGGSLVDMVDPVALISSYNPRKQGHPVTKILKANYQTKKVIAFKHGTKTVAVKEVSEYLRELEQGFPEREFIEVDGLPAPLYPVGMTPDNMVAENPIYIGEPLRGSNETCGRTNRSWSGVPFEVRQFVWLGVNKTQEIRVADVDKAHDIIDHAHEKDMLWWRKRYANTSIMFDQLKPRNQLPTLLVELNPTAAPAANVPAQQAQVKQAPEVEAPTISRTLYANNPKITRMSDSIRVRGAEGRITALLQDLEAAQNQAGSTVDAVSELKLQRQVEDILQKIEAQEAIITPILIQYGIIPDPNANQQRGGNTTINTGGGDFVGGNLIKGSQYNVNISGGARVGGLVVGSNFGDITVGRDFNFSDGDMYINNSEPTQQPARQQQSSQPATSPVNWNTAQAEFTIRGGVEKNAVKARNIRVQGGTLYGTSCSESFRLQGGTLYGDAYVEVSFRNQGGTVHGRVYALATANVIGAQAIIITPEQFREKFNSM